MVTGGFPKYKMKKEVSSKGLGNQLLALSLFIILLAFFALLNAKSNYDEQKSKAVLQSLERSFAIQTTGTPDLSARIEDPRQRAGAGEALDKIEGILRAQSIPFEVQQLSGNGEFYIELDKNKFLEFIGIGVGKKNDVDPVFMAKLIILLQPQNLITQYKVKIALGMASNPVTNYKKTPQSVIDAIKITDQIANQFIKHGLERKQIEITIEHTNPEKITLYFDRFKEIEQGEIVKDFQDKVDQSLDVQSQVIDNGEG